MITYLWFFLEVASAKAMNEKGHVNNVVYNRYAETGRVDWFHKIATFVDPQNAKLWRDMLTPKGDGLILRKITTEFKFVSALCCHFCSRIS